MAKKKPIGFTKEELATSTGFLDEADIRFTKSRFLVTDYGGKASAESVVFQTTAVHLETDEEYDSSWKVSGTPDDWEIINDGDGIYPISKKAKKGVNVMCKFGQLITSLLNAGAPDSMLDGSAASFDGLEAHMIRIDNPHAMKDDEGNLKKDDVLVVDSINVLPGGESPDAKAEEEEQEAKGEEIEKLAEDFVTGLLKKKEYKDGVTKKQLPKPAMAEFGGKDYENDILALLFDDNWLKDKARPWDYDKAVITAE